MSYGWVRNETGSDLSDVVINVIRKHAITSANGFTTDQSNAPSAVTWTDQQTADHRINIAPHHIQHFEIVMQPTFPASLTAQDAYGTLRSTQTLAHGDPPDPNSVTPGASPNDDSMPYSTDR